MNSHWKIISSESLLDHPRMDIVEDTVLLPTNTKIKYVKIVNQPDSVTVICVKDNQVLIQQEYSYPVNEVMYQFPGGKIDSGESPTAAGLRELEEESNYTSTSCAYLGFYYANNRRSDAKMHVVVVNNPIQSDNLAKDEEEFIESHWVDINNFQAMIKDGQIINYSILAGWTLYQANQ